MILFLLITYFLVAGLTCAASVATNDRAKPSDVRWAFALGWIYWPLQALAGVMEWLSLKNHW